jgi:hypothetical protein
MSNLEINGMRPHAEKVSVLIDHLERIGNELRVHFGKKQEGTTEVHIGSDPLVIKGGGMKKQGPGYFEYIATQGGTTLPDYEKLASAMYGEFFDKDIYIGQMTEPLVRTIKVPGATMMKIKMSYACSGGSGRPQGYLQGNYLWLGAGLHEDASKVQGEYYPGFIAKSGVDWQNLEEHKRTCAGCGQPVYTIGGADVVLPPEGAQAWTHPCEDENGWFPILHEGPVLPVIEREISGDSFTCSWMVDFTGNAYTSPDEDNYIGYYIEVTPYNELGVMANYIYTIDEIPNEFSIDDMDYMISKLNNYPNAEEVKF